MDLRVWCWFLDRFLIVVNVCDDVCSVFVYFGFMVVNKVRFVFMDLMMVFVVGMVFFLLVLICKVVFVVFLMFDSGILVIVVIVLFFFWILVVVWIRFLLVLDWEIIRLVVCVIDIFVFIENIDGGREVIGMLSLCMNL